MLQNLSGEFRRGAYVDRPILTGIFIVWCGLIALLALKGVNGVQVSSYAANLALYLSALIFFLVYWTVSGLLRNRPQNPIGFLAASARSEQLVGRLLRGLPMLLALVIFLPAFSAMKSAIPLFNEYRWDQTWIQLDASLHGSDPWQILNVIIGDPLITSIFSALYQVWILLIYAGGVYFCFFQDNAELRARYFVAYFACWAILGVAMATAFASVGPCFLEPFLGDRHFAQQMASLRVANESMPVFSLLVQDRLIDWYAAGNNGLGRGISAMPSMHVSLAFLFFLAMRKVSRLVGIGFGVFALIILTGSVHLAYHYAVDGYVSIVSTWLIWIASGPLARRVARRADKA